MSKGNRRNSQQASRPSRRVDPAVLVALIGAIATILVALFNFSPFEELFEEDPTPTPIVTATNTSTVEALSSSTSTLDQNTIAPTETETLPTATDVLPTATLPAIMHVQLEADRTSGKVPLTVKLDARASYLLASDGRQYPCLGGPCNYTWAVYGGGNLINKSERSSNGRFTYRFPDAGTYKVVVTVCRGQGDSDCAADAALITVTK